MDWGAEITRWTIRLALACFASVIAAELWPVEDAKWRGKLRGVWTLGCALFLAHLAAAFHFYHHWSHAHAMEHTARQTQEMIGWAFGEGIFFSYLFAALWTLDAALRWKCLDNRQDTNSRRIVQPGGRHLVHWALYGYLFFIAFNGAIVFEGGPTRWAGVAVCGVLAAIMLRRIVRRILAAAQTRARRQGSQASGRLTACN